MRKLESRRYNQRELAGLAGKRIQAFRRERRWSTAFLANLLEIKPEWLENYEMGRAVPPAYTLYQLAGVFGVSVGALLDEEPREDPLQSQRLVRILRRLELLPKGHQSEIAHFLETVLRVLDRIGYV
jgi:transcriptional regulator with XRE-family HTH domain